MQNMTEHGSPMPTTDVVLFRDQARSLVQATIGSFLSTFPVEEQRKLRKSHVNGIVRLARDGLVRTDHDVVSLVDTFIRFAAHPGKVGVLMHERGYTANNVHSLYEAARIYLDIDNLELLEKAIEQFGINLDDYDGDIEQLQECMKHFEIPPEKRKNPYNPNTLALLRTLDYARGGKIATTSQLAEALDPDVRDLLPEEED